MNPNFEGTYENEFLDTLFNNILLGLKRNFYYHLTESISESQFSKLVDQLGTVIRKEDVRLYASKRLVHQPDALRYHTDQPYVDIIAWQCIIPDAEGPTLLLNMAELLNHFEQRELDLLNQVVVFYPNPDDLSDLRPERLLQIVDGYYRLFYISFRGSKAMPPELQLAWQRFNAYVEEQGKNSAFGVTLEKGQCLFLHNRTFFHARPALKEDSKRFLNRIWIKSNLVKGMLATPRDSHSCN